MATTSRAKALAAWGVARDLFKDGDAKEITEGPDHDAALATPGETIRRGLSVDVGKVTPVARPRTPSRADAERVAALKRELDSLKAKHDRAAADLDARRERLDEEAGDLEREFREQAKSLSERLDAAGRKLRS